MSDILPITTTCGFCQNISKMDIIGYIEDHDKYKIIGYDNSLGYPPEQYDVYCLLKCPACSMRNIVKYYSHEDMEFEDEISYENIFPLPKNIPIGLPEKILKAYNAAEKVKTIDVNAYVILQRRLLELVCIDRGAIGNTLALMLKDLANKNEIPDKLVKVAKGLKDFENIGAHAGIGDLSEEEIPIVTSLCSAVLEYIYSAPYLALTAETKLDKIRNR